MTKILKTLLIASAAFAFMGPSAAQSPVPQGPVGFTVNKPVACTTNARALTKFLKSEYGEKYDQVLGISTMDKAEGAMVIIYKSKDTFTVVEKFTDGIICIVSTGNKKPDRDA